MRGVMGRRAGPCTDRGSDTFSAGRRRTWQGVTAGWVFLRISLSCLREKYPFLSLLLAKGRRGRLSCPKDRMGEAFSPAEGETGVGER